MSAPKIVFREDGSILLKEVVLSYPHLFTPWAKNPEKETPKYSARGLMGKATHAEEIKLLGQHIRKLEMEHFKGRLPSAALFMRDGKDSGKEEQLESWLVAASETIRPSVINRDKSPIHEADDIVYAGCVVNMLIKPWVQNNIHGKRLNANLLAVQFVRDGTRFGAERPDVQEAFDAVDGDFEDGGEDVDPFA